MQSPINGVVVMSVNDRMMFTKTAFNLFDSIIRFGMPVMRGAGPYWEQSIQNAIHSAVHSNHPNTGKPFDYVIFFDGDSVWEPDDLQRLVTVLEKNPQYHAAQAVQADRNADKPLAFAWLHELGIQYDHGKPVTEIIHGHFGFTVIRADVFRKMSKPWFWSTPNEDGTWDLGRVTSENGTIKFIGKRDPDTNFWLKFKNAGFKVVQVNQVVVGHMELMCRWQEGPRVVSQTMRELENDGKPEGLRSPFVGELTPDQMSRGPGGNPLPPPRSNVEVKPPPIAPGDILPEGNQ